MGYYTQYDLEVIDGDDKLIAELVSENKIASYAIDANGQSYDRSKWYRHQLDMRKFSTKHPDALFKLSGDGDGNLDIWVEYYRNGKMQRCEAVITMPDYDESMLK